MPHDSEDTPANNMRAGGIRVLLVDDDPYSRDLMSLLLTRDWRTRVVDGVGHAEAHRRQVAENAPAFDAVVVDGDYPSAANWTLHLAAPQTGRQAVLLCTLNQVTGAQVEQIRQAGFQGCLLKGELGYCLADAVVLAHANYWVMTPGVCEAARERRIALPDRQAVLSGSRRIAGLSPMEQRIARLAILFEQSREDIADDLGLTNAAVRQAVSQVYEKIGLRALLDGVDKSDEYFADPFLVAQITAHLEAAKAQGRKRPIQKSTLAFHLLTAGEVDARPLWGDRNAT